MGCCLSTPATANKTRHRRLDDSKSRIQPGLATPSSPFEKETVKEVLPENPTPISIPVFQDTTQILQENAGKKSIQENVTETSEMCSCSESYTANTKTTLTNSKIVDVVEIEDDGEVTQRRFPAKFSAPRNIPRKQPAKFSGEYSKEKDGGVRLPARRLASPSPMRKNRSPSKTLQTTQRHRNLGPSGVVRRDLPARRSRPPAIRGQRLNFREGNAVPAKNSGDQIRVKSAGNERKVKVVEVGVPPEPERGESLDNPVVSMECFIFL